MILKITYNLKLNKLFKFKFFFNFIFKTNLNYIILVLNLSNEFVINAIDFSLI